LVGGIKRAVVKGRGTNYHASLPYSHFQSTSEESRIYNTHLVLDNHGKVAGKYNKLHLFDIDIKGGVRLKESDSFIPGKEMPPVVKTPVGNVGLSIVSLNDKEKFLISSFQLPVQFF
jgi:predicted amidohydrolase